jgi:hypothetical protein
MIEVELGSWFSKRQKEYFFTSMDGKRAKKKVLYQILILFIRKK